MKIDFPADWSSAYEQLTAQNEARFRGIHYLIVDEKSI
jgi:hypothetical protein